MKRKVKDSTLLWETLTAQPPTKEAPEALGGDRAGGTRRLPFDKRCVAITKSGRRCRGRIRKGLEFCPFHDPALTADRRRRNAAKGGRSHHRLARLPDGYLRKLTTRRALGDALDRLYREVRVGEITSEMGRVLFAILKRLEDSGLCDGAGTPARSSPRSKAARLRSNLSELLTREERRAWRQAVANAPAAFIQNESGSPTAPKESATSPEQPVTSDTAIRLAVTVAS